MYSRASSAVRDVDISQECAPAAGRPERVAEATEGVPLLTPLTLETALLHSMRRSRPGRVALCARSGDGRPTLLLKPSPWPPRERLDRRLASVRNKAPHGVH